MSNTINFNGQIVEAENLHISINNRAFKFGDSIFEDLKVVKNNILYWEVHYFKLMAAMRVFRMKIPDNFDMDFLANEILKISNLSSSEACLIRLTICRKDSEKLLTQELSVDYYIEKTTDCAGLFIKSIKKYEVDLYKDFYENPSLISTIETSSNILAILSQIFAFENDLDDCLILNYNKSVIGAAVGNLFLVKGHKIKTPPLEDGCKKGILRNEIIHVIKKSALYTLDETSVSPFELQDADELFLTHITYGIIPISKFRKKVYGHDTSDYFLENLNGQIVEFI